ncbi:hypothetical protein PDQ75_25025 [Bacillus cereus group sp. Bc015]|uniref:hypothetical protein n=1 Tax=Bacillus cereus group sp. Bc015 TaxID=3018123 RepID=UPI0022E18224|nr:hypothetical protein [Bacillus cereus group sp. Bc015]MDA2738420.1 hypothetical protein [Bacillus cereus group sp. Bc015]
MSYKAQFEKEVESLLAIKEILPLEVRLKQVEDLTEWYFNQTGRHYNNSFYLDMLGSYLLADILRDKGTHKVKKTEYPILSHTQQKLRNRRERRVGDDNIDFIKLKEVDNHPNAFKSKTQNKDE